MSEKNLNDIEEKIDKINKIQEKAVKYSEDFPYLLITFATGVGKTLTALKIAIKNIKEEKNEDDKKWTILIEETSQISSWNQEFKKHGLESYRKYFEIITYASLKRNNSKRVILDECHHAISSIRITGLKHFKLEKIVALSATMDKFKKDKLNQLGTFKHYNYPFKQAIKDGILPKPEIKVHLIDLDNSQRNVVYKKTKGNKKDRLKVICDYETFIEKHSFTSKPAEYHIRCTPKEYYKLISEEIESYKKNYIRFKQKGIMFKWLNISASRKKFVAEQKTEVLKNIIKQEKTKKRYIVFCGSIKQAKDVKQYDNIVHSGKKNSENTEIIEKFNKKRINSLFCVQKLREGVNLYDLDFGIIAQIDSGSLSFIQMVGRALRSEKPIVHIMIVKNTKDQEYYEKIKKEIGEEFFTEV